jgi:hypothetical protein
MQGQGVGGRAGAVAWREHAVWCALPGLLQKGKQGLAQKSKQGFNTDFTDKQI